MFDETTSTCFRDHTSRMRSLVVVLVPAEFLPVPMERQTV